jgi:GT2 family glycosyltransferase
VASVSQPVAPGGLVPADDTDGDEEPVLAPPAVAVVVACDPGPWFEECLQSFGDQDYPNLSILVIDCGNEGVDPRVADVQPSAYVRRVDANRGFGPSANEVLDVVEGAAFYVICHDDVALAPSAVRAMVEEAFRSNAGIVTPKVVEWDNPSRLLSVGESADKTGVRAPLVEPGELDQEQHDAVRDVFCAPGGCVLVRADLFAVLGGFDPEIELLGEDLDLSWRAQVAGARVVAVPAAVVRHRQASDGERPIPDHRLQLNRHRLRTMLTCYGRFHLLRVLPQAILLALGGIIYSLFTGQRRRAGDVASAWRWNLQRLGEIRANRKRLSHIRQLPDSEVRRLQMHGSAQLGRLVQGQVGGDDETLSPVAAAGRELAGSLRSRPLRIAAGVWAGVVVVVLFGSRHLLFGHIPAFADLPAFPGGPSILFTKWFSGWRNAGLGSESAAPTAFAMLGGSGVVFLGAMSALRRVLFLGLIPVGIVGTWRLGRGMGSSLARLVTLVTFLAIPLPYDAVARGRWGGLLIWAAAPWLVLTLARQLRTPLFGRPDGPHRPFKQTALGLGLAVAVLTAFEPIAAVVVLVIAVGLLLGSVVVLRVHHMTQPVVVAVGAVVVAFVLHLPWSFDFVLPGSQWSAIGGVQSVAAQLDIGEILRFQTGPIGGAPWGWAFLVLAALPLFIGRDWRFEWAARAWVLALTCWTVAWIGQQTWFGHALGPPEALLAPAAVGLSLSAGLGLLAFEHDLPGYRFGWRQVAWLAAAAALAVGVAPVLVASFDGRWNSPDEGFESVLAFVNNDQATVGPYRVAWIGDPDVLPLAGWQLQQGVSFASTDHGLPSVEDRWAGSSDGATSLMSDAFHLAERRDTSRLGRLLAPMGVRYIVVESAAAPEGQPTRPVPPAIDRSLGEQLDLQQVLADPHVQVYRNVAWAPTRTALSPAAAVAAGQGPYFDVAAGVDLAGSPPLLTDHSGYTSASGKVNDGTDMYLADASSSRWSLKVDGRSAPRSKAFGWANAFTVDKGGTAKLSFTTPFQRYGILLVQVALWVGAIVLLVRWRRRAEAPS